MAKKAAGTTPAIPRDVKLAQQAQKRVSRAIRSIRSVGLLNKYQPTEQQITKILGVLTDQIVETATMLRKPAGKPGALFQL